MPDALRVLILTAAGWVNRHQEDVIDYLREENRVLREHLGPRPLRLNDAQRRRLAVRGQTLGRLYCGEDDLFGSGHPPDTVVAMALAYHAFKTGRQPGDYGVTI